ncbi:MAG: nucleotide sugar dehydrogenase, partial [Chloroflexota bacterium]
RQKLSSSELPLTKRILIVNKSTVPIGTVRLLQRILNDSGVTNVGVASNPEFLAQGKAIEGSRRPDRLVIGADTSEDFDILRDLYSEFVSHVRIRYIETTPETAEAIKYVGNTLLLTYISFWNGVGARLAETFDNISMEDLRLGVTSDARISNWGAYVSNGAGGSCFGKDIRSLIYQMKQTDNNTNLLQAVYNINQHQKCYLIERATSDANYNFGNKTVALLGLTYKKQTNDMRDSASLNAVNSLLAQGVSAIHAYDPLANNEAQSYWFSPDKNPLYSKIKYFLGVQAAIEDSDALYISTDWEEFRTLSNVIKRTVTAPYLIIDGRRMLADYQSLISEGYSYLPVGGKFQPGNIN